MNQPIVLNFFFGNNAQLPSIVIKDGVINVNGQNVVSFQSKNDTSTDLIESGEDIIEEYNTSDLSSSSDSEREISTRKELSISNMDSSKRVSSNRKKSVVQLSEKVKPKSSPVKGKPKSSSEKGKPKSSPEKVKSKPSAGVLKTLNKKSPQSNIKDTQNMTLTELTNHIMFDLTDDELDQL